MSVVHAPSPMRNGAFVEHLPGLAVERRTACRPWGAMIAGAPATYTVAVGEDRWERVTCKACLR